MEINNNQIITIIAYRPDGTDTCRGCEMGRSSSDFDLVSSDDIEELTNFLFLIKKSDYDDREFREIQTYEVTFLVGGKESRNWEDGQQWIVDLINDLAASRLEEHIVKMKVKQEQDLAKKEADYKKIKEDEERLLLLKLKEKYE